MDSTDRPTSAQTHALPVGFKFFWYEIRAVLGQGGFGITYLAHDTNLDQPVAIKEYLPILCATRGSSHQVVPLAPAMSTDYQWGLTRFLEEGKVLAKFDHPAVVRVLSVFEAFGTAYLVMRYEQGETLESRLKRERKLSENVLRGILDDVMSGLEIVHAAGFIHRDVKPANIYLRGNGQALLIDFGAARQAMSTQTQTVTALVSPGYAPFEQYRSDGAAQGPWTDIYGLGATAYRVITGRAPIPAVDRSHRIIDGVGDAQPRLTDSGVAGYSWGFLAAIDRALAFREQDRPRTIATWRELFDMQEPSTAEIPRTQPLGRDAPGTAPIAESPARPEREVATYREPLTASPTLLLDRQRRPRRSATLGIVIGVALGLYGLKLATEHRSASTTGAPSAAATSEATQASPTPGDPLHETSLMELLRAAEADMAAMRLTVPADNNALAKFRAVLARDPDNGAAKSGMDRIVGRYLDLATAAAQKQNFDAAREYLGKASQVNPHDRRIEAAALALSRHEAAPGPAPSG